MAKIAPSILAADFGNLERDIRDIKEHGGDWVHFDVMDGLFVPNISIGIPVLKSIRPTTDLPLDVHLMIEKPIRYVEQFVKAGADYVTIHVEADTVEKNLMALDKIAELGAKPSICVKPGTPAEAILPFVDKIAMVLVMTVEPGFGGQKFMADMMPKLRKIWGILNEKNPECLLEVDGGVDVGTAPVCRENGANVLVAGSAYFKATDRSAFTKTVQG